MPKLKKAKKEEWLKKFLLEQEGGYAPLHDDGLGIQTYGPGFNLQTPGMKERLQKAGIDTASPQVDPVKIDPIFSEIIKEKQKQLLSKLKSGAPGAALTPEKQEALTSMYYNHGNLIGPNLLKALDTNDDDAAIREIISNSNKHNLGHIQMRRVGEAMRFNPEATKRYMQSISPEEQTRIRGIVENNSVGADKETRLKALEELMKRQELAGLE
jgi:GH24 family phage-related lysozyme (muramidase)